MKRPRVLVVDDSAFARTALSQLLRTSGKVEVIGTARNGEDALQQIANLDPDVVTLDLTMPEVDGLDVLRALRARPRPRVIVVSMSSVDTEMGAEALALGAIDLVAKPTAFASDRLLQIGDELIAKVVACAETVELTAIGKAPAARPRAVAGGIDLIVLGTSTGGPQALTRLVSELPATLRAPLAIALHIPAGYTETLSRRLDKLSSLRVVEAVNGLELAPGMVVLARGGEHLRVERHNGSIYAVVSPLPLRPFIPSVDELFVSAARVTGARTLGVVLTGMGDDGLAGSRAIAEAGGALLAESAASSVVYGMPRCVYEADIGAVTVHLAHMVQEIVNRV